MFLKRWSPRAMSGEPLPEADLHRLLEAARWAPSSGNGQPWRFIYALGGTPAFATFLDVLVPANQMWCKRAGALICIVSKDLSDHGKPARTHSLDTGSAWMSMALQGSAMDLVVHGMAGFDYDRARTALKVPDGYTVECMVAAGAHGAVEELPPDMQAREKPSDRKPLEALCFEGAFQS